MSTINTADITGSALDWAVAKCEGTIHLFDAHDVGRLHYSTDWSQGGPILDRERMFVSPEFNGGDFYGTWRAIIFGFADQGDRAELTGPTPLIAAMRTYVASKMGDTIELTDDLS